MGRILGTLPSAVNESCPHLHRNAAPSPFSILESKFFPFVLDFTPSGVTIGAHMKTFAARYYWYWYPR